MSTDPCPAELQWRISHLAGLAPPPPPDLPPPTQPVVQRKAPIRALLMETAESVLLDRAEEVSRRAEREIAVVGLDPPAAPLAEVRIVVVGGGGPGAT